MVNRVATFAFTNTMIAENMRLQYRYADINTQVSSGLKSQTYKGVARDTQSILSIESAIDRLEAYNTDGNIILATVNTTYETLGRVEELANTMITALTASLGGNFGNPTVTQSQADNAMQETASLLNLQIAGRYIFSGSDILTPPVDLTDPAWIPQTSPSVVNTGYYQGNATINSVQVSESLTLDYGILASNSAFEQLLRAYNLAYNNPGSTTELSEALGLVQQAIDGIANIRGVLSIHSRTIENQIDQNSQDMSYLGELVSTMKEVDLPSASVQLTEVQTQMEAAYSASIRVLNLNLHDYLN